MAKKKLFLPDSLHYAKPFLPLFELTKKPELADVILFTGGDDVSPSLYGEKTGLTTFTAPARDLREVDLFNWGYKHNKKFLGICRGAQFLCVMAGGKLAQHIYNHNGGYDYMHRLVTSTGEEFDVNSLHHQMMLPKGSTHELLGWTERLSHSYLNGDNARIPDIEVEPEVVYFNEIKALGIQCHPEKGMEKEKKAQEYFLNLIKERLL
jgi:putative glutamine amidotransferase